MGHYGKFGYVQWAAAANLVMGYGPLREIWLCKKSKFPALWATAANLILCYAPKRSIWFFMHFYSDSS
jgi:hypothetical protein